MAALREAGLLAAPLATTLGGAGWGLEPLAARDTATALRLIGRASLPLGRLLEGHVNALRLVQRRGSPAAVRLAAEEARAGLLFGVWNTEAPGEAPLTLGADGVLRGRKILCSGAGHVARALVTARDAADPAAPPRMVLAPLAPAERADLSAWTAQGMRASATGAVDFTGLAVGAERIVGLARRLRAPAGLLGRRLALRRRPLRRRGGGAGRICATICAARAAAATRTRPPASARPRWRWRPRASGWRPRPSAPRRRGRRRTQPRARSPSSTSPAWRWSARGWTCWSSPQRSVGLSAFMRPNPVERVMRDLATYLRQPSPDGALAAAARHVLEAPGHPGDLWD